VQQPKRVGINGWFHDRLLPSSGELVVLLVARRTNNRKVVGSMPANVVCITVERFISVSDPALG